MNFYKVTGLIEEEFSDIELHVENEIQDFELPTCHAKYSPMSDDILQL